MRPSVIQSVLVRPFVCVSICLSACLYVCVRVSVCLSVHSSACFSFCLSIYLSVCLHDCLSLCLSANQFLVLKLSLFNEAKNYMAENKRPAVFCILGCTRSSRPTWFNGWWHPLRSVWQGDSKSWRPEQGWLPRYIWKSYLQNSAKKLRTRVNGRNTLRINNFTFTFCI